MIAEVIWEKPFLLKGKAETETMSGTKKYYEVFGKELYTEVALTGKKNNYYIYLKVTKLLLLRKKL